MANSKTDICNQALVLVGANTINSFDENTTEAKVSKQLYDSTLENLLTRCRWRFAIKQQQLSKLTTNPLGRYDSAYSVPSDALVLNTITVSDSVIEYDRYGSEIYTDTTSNDVVIADYTYQPSEADFPPYFTQSLVFELASLFAGAIARNDSLSTLYQNKATVQLAVAKAQDSQAQTNRRVDVNRYRNRRNSGSLGTVKATVSS
tara:strand:+ start:1810 stop:2421 length:612 start_codon:yes stop_codon:yes gene_type:complete